MIIKLQNKNKCMIFHLIIKECNNNQTELDKHLVKEL